MTTTGRNLYCDSPDCPENGDTEATKFQSQIQKVDKLCGGTSSHERTVIRPSFKYLFKEIRTAHQKPGYFKMSLEDNLNNLSSSVRCN